MTTQPSISAADVERAFREELKALSCPHCDSRYTDYAATWSDAWREGRLDAQRELDRVGRDGPLKLKCELCGGKALSDAFLSPPKAI